MNRLSVLAVLGLASAAAAWPRDRARDVRPPAAAARTYTLPAPAAAEVEVQPPRVREWEVPRPPIVLEQPPRRFREVTQTYEITAPAAEVLELPAAELPAARTYAPPAARTYALPAVEAAPAGRVPVTSFRTGCNGRRLNVVYSDGRTVQFGPLGRPRFNY
jgi:hypothetical protein